MQTEENFAVTPIESTLLGRRAITTFGDEVVIVAACIKVNSTKSFLLLTVEKKDGELATVSQKDIKLI